MELHYEKNRKNECLICKDKDVFLSFDKNYYKLSDGDAKEENADGILWEACYTDSTIYRRLQQMWREFPKSSKTKRPDY